MNTDSTLQTSDLGLQTSHFALRPSHLEKGDFWLGLATMSSGRGLMADWEWAFGSTVAAVRPFLKVTGEQATTFPCPADAPCGCRHTIGELRNRGLVASCCCPDGECATFRLEPGDILFLALEWRAFGDAVRRALGLGEVSGSLYSSPRLVEFGNYAAVAAPVYLSLVPGDALAREIRKLVALREGPFLLLTPTGSGWSAEVEALARPHAGGHISLSSVLDVEAGSFQSAPRFKSRGTLEPMLAEFARRVASLRASGGTLESILHEIAAVRGEFVELHSAKQRLEKMLADGLFAFTKKVDATSFKVLCTILSEGDVSKASRTLGMADSSMRTLLRRWRGRGKEYRAMRELIRWRKSVGRKETVPLNDNVLLGQARNSDYPELVADLLEKVTEMTGDNWHEKAEDLEEMLRAAAGG